MELANVFAPAVVKRGCQLSAPAILGAFVQSPLILCYGIDRRVLLFSRDRAENVRCLPAIIR
jgi:hypothetical protein